MSRRSPLPVGRGDVLNETYELDRQIGEGGFGAVWVARHRHLGRNVAVKFLLEGAPTADGLERFFREAKIASELDHPNIVKVIDYNFLPTKQPYIVMEFFEGESLKDRLAHGPLALGSALDIAGQIGDALAALHAAGVIHRDLKPANVLLCPALVGGKRRDRVKVIDFGIAKVLSPALAKGQFTDLTVKNGVGLTPSYASPEQIRGDNDEIDERADVFAFGAIVYEMLSGRRAFSGASRDTAPLSLAQIAPALPAHVASAVERALEVNPAKRFDDAQGLIDALLGGGNAEPIPVTAPQQAPPPRPPRGEAAAPATTATEPRPLREATTATIAPPRPPAVGRWVLPLGVLALAAIAIAGALLLRPPADAALPPHVAGELRRAETALAEGRVWDAIDIASGTLDQHKSDEAFALITRAYCRQGDAKSAEAELRKLSAEGRRGVIRYCREAGVELP
jgi:serine/threonine-protein kinase